ncbi:MAG: hypothetical protein LH702_32675 [Phormidesmis sp. CAN_BIN44]|nr:hypothetical protein [Phormidesmis sp. CAN_BIN44]
MQKLNCIEMRIAEATVPIFKGSAGAHSPAFDPNDPRDAGICPAFRQVRGCSIDPDRLTQQWMKS